MQVFVTGASGFVGQEVVKELLARGHKVKALMRRSPKKPKDWEQVEVVLGDCLHPAFLQEAVRGSDAVIHLVGIIREFPGRGITFERLHVEATKNVVDAAKAAGVRRYLHMSALGARPEPADPYHVTNFRADCYVMQSGLTYTIFRPSLIYGPRDQSINLFARQIMRLPFVSIVGDGTYQLQPVPVWIVAQAFALALELPDTENKIYEVGGPEPLTFDEIIDTIAAVLNRKVSKIHQPLWCMQVAASLCGRFRWFPLTSGQLRMLLEGNTCDPSAFYRDFGLTPVPFRQGLARYLPDTLANR
ncbi:MAG: complex I NDUFA9 subunit family protein [Deltaproteobacteria bacterium]|nr:complex I NDUFA9 subunit family protein [Deltaproteobacteria bacterium]